MTLPQLDSDLDPAKIRWAVRSFLSVARDVDGLLWDAVFVLVRLEEGPDSTEDSGTLMDLWLTLVCDAHDGLSPADPPVVVAYEVDVRIPGVLLPKESVH